MKVKLIKLIRILQEKTRPCTASFLANELDVSPRSIKNYIQEINEQLPQTVISSNRGYLLDKEKAITLLEKSESSIPQTSNERVTYIINRLIDDAATNAYDLCDEMFISYSTLKNELSKVRKKIATTDLELVTQADLLIIKGLEKNKRKLLSNLLYSESNINFINFNTISTSFSEVDVDFVRNTILQTFEEFRYFINDYSLANLVLHVTIAVDRILNGYIDGEENKSIQSFIRLHEHQLAKSIVKKLENQYAIEFNTSEVDELTLLIISRATNLNYKSVNENNLAEIIGTECFDLVVELINQTGAYYYMDLSEPEFFVRFALHIKNLLVRCKSHYFSKNPLTESIKQSCPLIYDVAVHISSTIYKRHGVRINDDEIAYIAFHLGGALEIQKRLLSRITVCIYCPNYYDLNVRLTDNINRLFQDSILITDVVTEEAQLVNTQSDLVISTLQLNTVLATPVLVVNPFLTDKDINAIQLKINEIKVNKSRRIFSEHLKYLINPNFFERLHHCASKEELINHMCEKMRQYGYVSETFEEEILEREQMSSTAFGNFAIPHAMRMHAIKTGMNVVILDESIDWDGKLVNLIMMLSFNKNERYIFNEIFEPLTMMLTYKENIKTVLNCPDYQHFIDTLVSFITET